MGGGADSDHHRRGLIKHFPVDTSQRVKTMSQFQVHILKKTKTHPSHKSFFKNLEIMQNIL
jgi:hypothetical protein